MKKYKNRIKFIVAITVLILISLSSLVISKMQDNQLIGHLQVEKIKNERLDV